ncbi:MAG: hypothetical protein Q9160_006315 [Pyrenula sp. 1 TL-2023]
MTSFFTPQKPVSPPATPAPPGDDEPVQSKHLSLKRGYAFEDESGDDDTETTLLNIETSHDVKQNRVTASAKTSKRRCRNSNEGYNPSQDESDSDEDIDGTTFLGSSPTTKAVRDRRAMPPPSLLEANHSETPERHAIRKNSNYVPKKNLVDRNLTHKIVRKENYESYGDEDSDEEVLKPSNALKRSDRREIAFDSHDAERARRQAEVNNALIQSGSWSSQEKDLFARLAMRGFEPLVPEDWYIDFNTLPSPLFSNEDGEPALIQEGHSNDFRARTQLRTLITMGMRARDRRLVNLRSEPTMRKILTGYLDWALRDSTLHPSQRPNTIPIHAIAHQRPHEKTNTVITRLTSKLSDLAHRYRDFQGIHPSVEPPHSDSTALTAADEEDPRFPILTGFMICASIIVIATLDSNPALAPPPIPPTTPSSRGSTPYPSLFGPEKAPAKSFDEAKEESGLRIIAMLDFSEPGMDVWHALAVAITVMRIRRTMQEMMEFMCGEEGSEREKAVWELAQTDGKNGELDDEDA